LAEAKVSEKALRVQKLSSTGALWCAELVAEALERAGHVLKSSRARFGHLVSRAHPGGGPRPKRWSCESGYTKLCLRKSNFWSI